jgi:hypothetical protein
MPAIRVHSLFDCSLNITIASPRPDGVPSYIIPNGKLHDEIASKIRAAMREYKHLGENEGWVGSAKQVCTYLPANFYAVRTLDPAGSIVEVDEGFLLDVLRLRYVMVFAILPASLQADEGTGEAFERHWQKAFRDLFVTGYGFTGVFVPGDVMDRNDNSTTIDVQLEMGGAKGTMRFEKSPS